MAAAGGRAGRSCSGAPAGRWRARARPPRRPAPPPSPRRRPPPCAAPRPAAPRSARRAGLRQREAVHGGCAMGAAAGRRTAGVPAVDPLQRRPTALHPQRNQQLACSRGARPRNHAATHRAPPRPPSGPPSGRGSRGRRPRRRRRRPSAAAPRPPAACQTARQGVVGGRRSRGGAGGLLSRRKRSNMPRHRRRSLARRQAAGLAERRGGGGGWPAARRRAFPAHLHRCAAPWITRRVVRGPGWPRAETSGAADDWRAERPARMCIQTCKDVLARRRRQKLRASSLSMPAAGGSARHALAAAACALRFGADPPVKLVSRP